ncbi:hypothetical protein QJQ45_012994 [Haematococcus lacustris]|nr:hypothetical protein QJQ45_012994 [Haematococcus lacustris]
MFEHQSVHSHGHPMMGTRKEEPTWISWFCSLRGNEFFCEVDEDYIEDDFNLSGLSSQVPYYDYALDMILDNEAPNDVMLTDQQQELLESAAEMLYGLIHARYMDMHNDAQNRKIFCPKCEDIFYPRSEYQCSIDGAYYGTTVPHLLLMTYPMYRPPKCVDLYVPRVFGFKLHATAYGSREQAPPRANQRRIAAAESRQRSGATVNTSNNGVGSVAAAGPAAASAGGPGAVEEEDSL